MSDTSSSQQNQDPVLQHNSLPEPADFDLNEYQQLLENASHPRYPTSERRSLSPSGAVLHNGVATVADQANANLTPKSRVLLNHMLSEATAETNKADLVVDNRFERKLSASVHSSSSSGGHYQRAPLTKCASQDVYTSSSSFNNNSNQKIGGGQHQQRQTSAAVHRMHSTSSSSVDYSTNSGAQGAIRQTGLIDGPTTRRQPQAASGGISQVDEGVKLFSGRFAAANVESEGEMDSSNMNGGDGFRSHGGVTTNNNNNIKETRIDIPLDDDQQQSPIRYIDADAIDDQPQSDGDDMTMTARKMSPGSVARSLNMPRLVQRVIPQNSVTEMHPLGEFNSLSQTSPLTDDDGGATEGRSNRGKKSKGSQRQDYDLENPDLNRSGESEVPGVYHQSSMDQQYPFPQHFQFFNQSSGAVRGDMVGGGGPVGVRAPSPDDDSRGVMISRPRTAGQPYGTNRSQTYRGPRPQPSERDYDARKKDAEKKRERLGKKQIRNEFQVNETAIEGFRGDLPVDKLLNFIDGVDQNQKKMDEATIVTTVGLSTTVDTSIVTMKKSPSATSTGGGGKKRKSGGSVSKASSVGMPAPTSDDGESVDQWHTADDGKTISSRPTTPSSDMSATSPDSNTAIEKKPSSASSFPFGDEGEELTSRTLDLTDARLFAADYEEPPVSITPTREEPEETVFKVVQSKKKQKKPMGTRNSMDQGSIMQQRSKTPPPGGRATRSAATSTYHSPPHSRYGGGMNAPSDSTNAVGANSAIASGAGAPFQSSRSRQRNLNGFYGGSRIRRSSADSRPPMSAVDTALQVATDDPVSFPPLHSDGGTSVPVDARSEGGYSEGDASSVSGGFTIPQKSWAKVAASGVKEKLTMSQTAPTLMSPPPNDSRRSDVSSPSPDAVASVPPIISAQNLPLLPPFTDPVAYEDTTDKAAAGLLVVDPNAAPVAVIASTDSGATSSADAADEQTSPPLPSPPQFTVTQLSELVETEEDAAVTAINTDDSADGALIGGVCFGFDDDSTVEDDATTVADTCVDEEPDSTGTVTPAVEFSFQAGSSEEEDVAASRSRRHSVGLDVSFGWDSDLPEACGEVAEVSAAVQRQEAQLVHEAQRRDGDGNVTLSGLPALTDFIERVAKAGGPPLIQRRAAAHVPSDHLRLAKDLNISWNAFVRSGTAPSAFRDTRRQYSATGMTTRTDQL